MERKIALLPGEVLEYVMEMHFEITTHAVMYG
jgi:hypothetical protein